jgi:hypothetical protein
MNLPRPFRQAILPGTIRPTGTSDQDLSWKADPGTKAEVMAKFAEAGARNVVAASPTALSSTQGWERIAGTFYYVHAILPAGR